MQGRIKRIKWSAAYRYEKTTPQRIGEGLNVYRTQALNKETYRNNFIYTIFWLGKI